MVLAVVRLSVYPVAGPCHFFGLMGRCLGAVWIFLTITRGTILFITILVVGRPSFPALITPSDAAAAQCEIRKGDKVPMLRLGLPSQSRKLMLRGLLAGGPGRLKPGDSSETPLGEIIRATLGSWRGNQRRAGAFIVKLHEYRQEYGSLTCARSSILYLGALFCASLRVGPSS